MSRRWPPGRALAGALVSEIGLRRNRRRHGARGGLALTAPRPRNPRSAANGRVSDQREQAQFMIGTPIVTSTIRKMERPSSQRLCAESAADCARPHNLYCNGSITLSASLLDELESAKVIAFISPKARSSAAVCRQPLGRESEPVWISRRSRRRAPTCEGSPSTSTTATCPRSARRSRGRHRTAAARGRRGMSMAAFQRALPLLPPRPSCASDAADPDRRSRLRSRRARAWPWRRRLHARRIPTAVIEGPGSPPERRGSADPRCNRRACAK